MTPRPEILLLCALWLLTCATPLARAECGEERASVKLGTDAGAQHVAAAIRDTTIAELTEIRQPSKLPTATRVAPVETSTYRLHAVLVAYKLEADGDYHLVLRDESGRTLIAEIPAADCASHGAWSVQVAAARSWASAALRPSSKLRHISIAVDVTGVGFFDVLHGQTGVAPNGIELHPVLAIGFGGAS
jgi:hypothetical protein